MSFFIRKRGSGARGSSKSASSSAGRVSLPSKLTDRAQGGRGKRTRGGPGGASSRGRGGGAHKRFKGDYQHNQATRAKVDDEEITSEEDDDEEEQVPEQHQEDEEHDEETEQEARIRLAKETLQQLRSKLDEHELLGDALKEQQLVEAGVVLRKICTDQWVAKPLSTRVAARGGKVLKNPLTALAVCTTTSSAFLSTKSGHVMKLDLTQVPAASRLHVKLPHSPVVSLAVCLTYVAAATPQEISLLSKQTLETLHRFHSSRNAVALGCSADTLYSTHKDRTVKLWNLQEKAFVEALFGHQDTPTCVDIADHQQQHGQRIVTTGGWDRTLRVWKIEEETQLVYNWDQDIIEVVKVLSGGFFVAGSCSGALGLFSFGRKKPLSVVPQCHGTDPNGVGRFPCAIGGQGDFVATGSDDARIRVWRVRERRLESVRDIELDQPGVIIGICVVVGSEQDVRVVAAVSYEARNGRWGGRVGKSASRVIVID